MFFRTAAYLPWRLAWALGRLALLALCLGLGSRLGEALGPAGAGTGLAVAAGVAFGFGLWLVLGIGLRGMFLSSIAAPHAAALGAGLTRMQADAPDGRDEGSAPPMAAEDRIAPSQARTFVRQQAGGALALFRLDRLVRSILRGVTALVDEGVATEGPVEAPDLRDRSLRLYRRMSTGPLAEMILGHALSGQAENGWDLAHDGTVLLAQNTDRLLGPVGRLVLAGWLLTGLVLLASLGPLQALAGALWGAEAGLVHALMLGLIPAVLVKCVLLDPLVVALLLARFHDVTGGQTPNAEWRGLMSHALPAFLHLGEWAESWKSAADPGLAVPE